MKKWLLNWNSILVSTSRTWKWKVNWILTGRSRRVGFIRRRISSIRSMSFWCRVRRLRGHRHWAGMTSFRFVRVRIRTHLPIQLQIHSSLRLNKKRKLSMQSKSTLAWASSQRCRQARQSLRSPWSPAPWSSEGWTIRVIICGPPQSNKWLLCKPTDQAPI